MNVENAEGGAQGLSFVEEPTAERGHLLPALARLLLSLAEREEEGPREVPWQRSKWGMGGKIVNGYRDLASERQS